MGNTDSAPSAPKSGAKPSLGFGQPGVSLSPSPAAAMGYLAEGKEGLLGIGSGLLLVLLLFVYSEKRAELTL